MAEQAGGGAGEQVLKSGGRAPGKSGPSIGAAPGRLARNRHTGGVGAPPGGDIPLPGAG